MFVLSDTIEIKSVGNMLILTCKGDFSTQETKVASTPLYGNKVKSLNLSSLAKSSCDFC